MESVEENLSSRNYMARGKRKRKMWKAVTHGIFWVTMRQINKIAFENEILDIQRRKMALAASSTEVE